MKKIIDEGLEYHSRGFRQYGVTMDWRESEILEFKKSTSELKEAVISISAILNHIEPKIYPSIETVNIKGKSCIKIEFKGEDIPYHAYGRVYIRVADEDKQLSPGEIRKVILKKSSDKFKWEFQFSECSSKEINAKIVRDYLKRANLAGRINFKYDNAPNVLKKLGLVKGSKILNAGQVLFRTLY